MANQNPETENQKVIKVDDVVSIKLQNNGLMSGRVVEVNDKTIVIDNYKQSLIKVPNNKEVYKFFPGQKFDVREFDRIDPTAINRTTGQPMTVREKLNEFLSKTNVQNFNNLMTNPKFKADAVALLKGDLTQNTLVGSTLAHEAGDEKKTGPRVEKKWECKLSLFKKDGILKLQTVFKQAQLYKQVYGVEVTPEELSNMIDKKQTVVLERVNKDNKPFKTMVKYDEKLNALVTSPYNEKLAELMKNAYAKKEELANSVKEEPKNIFKEKNNAEATNKEDVKAEKKKGKKI